jgi:hypothetical protein
VARDKKQKRRSSLRRKVHLHRVKMRSIGARKQRQQNQNNAVHRAIRTIIIFLHLAECGVATWLGQITFSLSRTYVRALPCACVGAGMVGQMTDYAESSRQIDIQTNPSFFSLNYKGLHPVPSASLKTAQRSSWSLLTYLVDEKEGKESCLH